MARMERTRVVVKEEEEEEEEALQKHLSGCMAGFFNIFDRPHPFSPKRLSSPPTSPLHSGNLKQSQSLYSTPDRNSLPNLPLPVMEVKEASPWRFSKEAPRLSLDSRAVVDAKGSLKPRQIHRPDSSGSPSVIARLMGLEPLPSSSARPLQRSASESRVTRDYRFVDICSDDKVGVPDPPEFHVRAQPARAPAAQRCLVRRKSVFDPADFFPEPRQCGAPPSDLENLMEALRLKGLLRSSNKPPTGNKTSHGIRSGAKGSVKSPNRRPTHKDRRVSPLPCRRPEPLQTPTPIEAEQELWKRQGSTLLERCDKLLHSIAEMAAAEAPGDSQPSPVSVLDASFYHDDSSPSPVMKRTLDFFSESEEDSWASSSDSEYAYISDILRASHWLPQESDIFSLLEKQQYLKGKCASRAASQGRRLVFDAVQEIVGRRRRLPPWRMVGEEVQLIWSEFQKMRNKSSRLEEDLVGYVCRVLGRDLSDDHRWRDCEVEMSQVVLDIERLVFKDLIGETIRHLDALNSSGSSLRMRRRLLF